MLYRQVRLWRTGQLLQRMTGWSAGLLLLLLVGSLGARFIASPPPPPALVGQLAPDFTLRSTNAQAVHLQGLRGRPVLLSFFATWCVNCQREAPVLQEIQHRYTDRVKVLAINGEKESLVRVSEYGQQYDPENTLLLDPKRVVTKRYQVEVYPTLVLIDRRGQVQQAWVGWQAEISLNEAVEQVIVNAR